LGASSLNTENTLYSLNISQKEIHAVIIGNEILSCKREDKIKIQLARKLNFDNHLIDYKISTSFTFK